MAFNLFEESWDEPGYHPASVHYDRKVTPRMGNHVRIFIYLRNYQILLINPQN